MQENAQSITTETQELISTVTRGLKDREALICYLRKEIVYYKSLLEGPVPESIDKWLYALPVETLIESCEELKQAFMKKLEEEYGVDQHRKM